LAAGFLQAARFARGRLVDDRATGLVKEGLTSFGQDACGRVYLTSLDGGLYRLSG